MFTNSWLRRLKRGFLGNPVGRRRPIADNEKRPRSRQFQPCLELLEVRVVPAFVITPTFGSTITSDPNAATIEATINTAIQNLENAFSDNITVNITFQEGNGQPGGSSTKLNFISYSAYLAALTSHATTADDTTALASLPAGPNSPV